MRSLPLLVLTVAACGGSSPHPATPAPQAPIANEAPPVPRATPAPSVAWAGTYGPWKLEGLPAVARKGELVVVPVTDTDGGRGYTNLRLEVRDRGDKIVRTIPILKSDENEQLAPGGAAGPELQRRIAAANEELARLHGIHDLVPMHGLEIEKPADGSDQHLAIGDGLDVDWSRDHLHVFRHDAQSSFITLDGTPWLAHPSKTAAGPCDNPAFLANAFHASEINVLVVVIGYKGTDLCWEPGDQPHVIAW